MDIKIVLADIKNNKIREGVLYKRSKFLKQWRQRWIVLTTNFLYTFTNKKMEQVTDVIDLKQIKSYKSYLRKDQEMIPPGFKLRSAQDMYYFCARNCYEKWSWLVSLERLMDYKYVGATNYNNMEWVKTKGFESQIQFENGGAKVPHIEPPNEKIQPEVKKNIDEEAQKIMKQLAQQQQQLEKKKSQLQKKEADMLKEQQKRKQEQKKVEQPPPQSPPVKQEVKLQQKPQQKTQQKQESGSKVSQIRSMFENKMNENKDAPMPKYQAYKKDKSPTKKQQTSIYVSRSKVINGLFEQFRKDAYQLFGMKYVIDFLVNVTADQKMGYSSYVIIQGKSHRNKQQFSEIFIELLSVHDDYQDCENLMKFIETCVFQMPGLFNPDQTAKIQFKLKDFFNAVNNQAKLQLIIKNMFIMHKICRYQKNDVFGKLDKLVKQVKNENTRNWAKKLRDDL